MNLYIEFLKCKQYNYNYISVDMLLNRDNYIYNLLVVLEGYY